MKISQINFQDEKINNQIAIIGGFGFIGSNLAQELLRLGTFQIRLLTRNPQDHNLSLYQESFVKIFRGDLMEPSSLIAFLEPNCTVINLMYSWDGGESKNLQMNTNLLNACKNAKIKRLIHCSTAAVVGRTTDLLVTESTPCKPVTEYGATKIKIEETIVFKGKSFFDVAIIRPTSVFGPAGSPLKKLVADLINGNPYKNYIKSCLFAERRMNLVSINNVVESIVFLINRKQNFNGAVFIVSDDECVLNNFSHVENFFIQKFNLPKYALPKIKIPLSILSLLLRCLGRNNINPHCNYSSNKLRGLGFVPPKSFETALSEYASWYIQTQVPKY